ncbi:hypothetical protein BKA65DRAFT_531925 [Rhexocercosporidium sp. MPI-PUGE-AT-0058]|nr:hypothetical protein BKA65DRAFT_531925 [Rhexocercosporidium sp. MPI-PUGE-AT-0058]
MATPRAKIPFSKPPRVTARLTSVFTLLFSAPFCITQSTSPQFNRLRYQAPSAFLQRQLVHIAHLSTPPRLPFNTHVLVTLARQVLAKFWPNIMAPTNTYSSTAVDGSADEFAPSSSVQAPKTPAQLAAEKALALQRLSSFISHTSIGFVPVPLDNSSTIASRHHAAQAVIAAFDAAFSSSKDGPAVSNL